MQTYGVYCDNRSIVRDIEAINQAYILVKEELDSVEEANKLLLDESNQLISRDTIYSNSYRINQERHSWHDWLMIAECISAARFVNEKESERLITLLGRCLHPDKLKEINKKVSRIQREKVEAKFLQRNLNEIYNTLYWENYFGKICECREKLSFYYITYSIDRLGKPFEKQLKEYCIVHPHKIVNHNGLHYLVAYDDTKRKMRAFRIDRMEKIWTEYDEKRNGIRLAAKMDFPSLASRTFDMCLGESTRVTIQCANDIFDTVYERFGTDDDVSYRECDDKCFEVSVILDVSPKFFGWLCGFGKDAKLVSPPSVVEEFAHYLDEIKSQY